MIIEEEIFKRCTPNYRELLEYGFHKKDNKYFYTKDILNNFKVQITIDIDGQIKGKIIDKSVNEEYILYRIKNPTGEYVNKVREAYKDILIDIKNNCFNQNYFVYNQANRITKYIINKYHDYPEFPWNDANGIFRNVKNQKWYAIIMFINKNKIDKSIDKEIEVMNIKLDNNTIQKLITKKGFYEAYHMNKKYWITIPLDDTLKDNEIIKYLDESYQIIDK